MPTTANQSTKPSTLVAKQICKTYGKRPILQGIDLSLTEGEAVGLLGLRPGYNSIEVVFDHPGDILHWLNL